MTSALDRTPRLDRPRFDCPLCGAFAQQAWVDLVRPVGERDWEYLDYQQAVGKTGKNRWKAASCGSCSEWSIWHDGSMVHPRQQLGAAPHADMPDGVRLLYTEAAAAAAVSRRAGAALARATLERLIRVIDPDAPEGATLEKRIDRLRPKVSTSLGKLLDVVRVTGNGALHVKDQPDDLVLMVLSDTEGPELVELLLQTANDLVDELIARPKTTNDLWNKIPEGIKARLQPRVDASSAEDDG